ncbi:hypothetical protein [Aquicoccus sp. SU-CL01552]|uniref:hypothetical protein n=1 Tax=Aquicoccus sp. SU-CL01552 TaxID=3127656 RepID=UPI003105A27E
MGKTRWTLRAVAGVAVLFGLLTMVSGGRALFGTPEMRAAVGDAVPFVLWFNFLAGFAYVAAGVGLFMVRSWAIRLSVAILVSTLLIMVAFWIHVAFGGAYEIRTAGALGLRTAIWGIIVAVALRGSKSARPASGRKPADAPDV